MLTSGSITKNMENKNEQQCFSYESLIKVMIKIINITAITIR